MRVREFFEKIDFHDSNVIELIHKDDMVRMKIDLCMWKQETYKEGDDEIKEMLLEFTGVSEYLWDSEKTEAEVDYDTILEMSYCEELLKIVLQDDEISILTFKCDKIMLE